MGSYILALNMKCVIHTHIYMNNIMRFYKWVPVYSLTFTCAVKKWSSYFLKELKSNELCIYVDSLIRKVDILKD